MSCQSSGSWANGLFVNLRFRPHAGQEANSQNQLLRKTFGLGYSRWSRCSFCRKYHNQVAKLIDGDRCFICNECIMVCFNLLIDELGEEFETINEQVQARRIGAIEGELRWLKKQFQEGSITEPVYEERQRELLRGNKLGEPQR